MGSWVVNLVVCLLVQRVEPEALNTLAMPSTTGPLLQTQFVCFGERCLILFYFYFLIIPCQGI